MQRIHGLRRVLAVIGLVAVSLIGTDLATVGEHLVTPSRDQVAGAQVSQAPPADTVEANTVEANTGEGVEPLIEVPIDPHPPLVTIADQEPVAEPATIPVIADAPEADLSLEVVDPLNNSIDNSGAFVITLSDDGLVAVPIAGGEPRVINPSPGLAEPVGLTVDRAGSGIYVLDANGPMLVRFNDDGERSVIELEDLSAVTVSGLAHNDQAGQFYIGAPDLQRVVAVDGAGQLVDSWDLSATGLSGVQSLAYGSTAESRSMALRVTDPAGDVVELVLESPLSLMATTATANLVATVPTSGLTPPSTDSAGIAYLEHRGNLLMSDSEINEEGPPLFLDVNLWEMSTSASVSQTGNTVPWSLEPTGVGYNPTTHHIYISDDTGGSSVHDVDPGTDGLYGTADDTVTSLSLGGDPEGVAWDRVTGTIFVVDGVGAEITQIHPGPDGLFNGVGDTVVGSFDVGGFGAGDPEGITHNTFDDTLLVLDNSSDSVYEISKTGVLIRTISILGASAVKAAGITLAPATVGPGWNMFIVDRGIDNSANPTPVDGMMYEMSVDFGPTIGQLPVAVNDAAGTTEEVAVVIDVAANDSDPDGNLDATTATSTTSPAGGSTTDNGDGTITYTPDTDFFGVDTFDYRICDTTSNCATARVTVTVTGTPDPPTAVADVVGTPQDAAIEIDVAANDSDPDGDLDLTSAAATSTPSSGATTDNGDGTITYTPDTGFFGPDSFSYEICDTTAICDTATVSITVVPAARVPVAVNDPAATPEDTAIEINVAANDSDPDGNLDLTSAAATSTPASGTTTDNGDGTITYTPDTNFFGPDTFDYRICDTTALCDTATVNITVTSVADSPTAIGDSAATGDDLPAVIDVAANDSDPDGNLDPTTATATTTPASGTTTDNGDGTITYTPDTGFFGVDTFDYRICDTTALCHSAAVRVTVLQAAHPPSAVDDSATTAEDTAIVIDVAANDSDPDGNLDPTTATATTTPASGTTTDNGDGTITYTPDTGIGGADTFDYRICDTTAICDTATVTVIVTAVLGGGTNCPSTGTNFSDVSPDRYYSDAVRWMVCGKITTGTSPTTYSPDALVTRAQVATFLWRIAGMPTVTGTTPFTDVPAGRYYSEAVAWMVKAGITTGTSSTTFSPDDPATRAEIATFLWRQAGMPTVTGTTPFTDVPAGRYYSEAVAWMVKAGITTGTSSTTFSPDDPATRAQIATFLWRRAGMPII